MTGNLIMVIAVVGVVAMFFYAKTLQKKQRKEHDEMLEKMVPGAEIRTVNGMVGIVTEVGDDWLRADFSPDQAGSVIEISKEAFLKYAK